MAGKSIIMISDIKGYKDSCNYSHGAVFATGKATSVRIVCYLSAAHDNPSSLACAAFWREIWV